MESEIFYCKSFPYVYTVNEIKKGTITQEHCRFVMINTLAIIVRPDDYNAISFVENIIRFCEREKIGVVLPKNEFAIRPEFVNYAVDEEQIVEGCDLVVVMGGDGTFLRAARLFSLSGKPIFGINRGQLGFLTEFGPHEYLSHLKRIFEGDYHISERTILEASVVKRGIHVPAASFINDAVISKGSFSRAIRLELELDGDYLNAYSGDGLIISTPTGSTAYSLSAGGPIIVPNASGVYLLSPICPHSLAFRPMIVPDDAVLKARIVSDLKNLLLTLDGQVALEIDGDDEVIFRKSKARVRLITHPDKNYYAILREKLGWG